MKKFLSVALSALILAFGTVFFAACNIDPDDPNDQHGDNPGGTEEPVVADIYGPDGARALALAQLRSEEMQCGGDVTYNVVDASTSQTFVTGREPQAELAILPVNLAAKLLGTGETYQMLGTVTHGNLYILAKTGDTQITQANIKEMFEGKKVGCLQLNNFVGYILRTVLNNAGVKFEVRQDKEERNGTMDTAYLYDVTGTEITPAADYDLMIAAEPAVHKKTTATSLKVVGDLQALYGENGYPQAVLVAKKTLIEESPDFIGNFVKAVDANAEWIKTADAQTIYDAVQENYGATPTFAVTDLTAEVIARCAIRFEASVECAQSVKTILAELSEAADQTFTVTDAFFYGLEEDLTQS